MIIVTPMVIGLNVQVMKLSDKDLFRVAISFRVIGVIIVVIIVANNTVLCNNNKNSVIIKKLRKNARRDSGGSADHGERPPREESADNGERPPRGESADHGERPPRGKSADHGERLPSGESANHEERPPSGESTDHYECRMRTRHSDWVERNANIGLIGEKEWGSTLYKPRPRGLEALSQVDSQRLRYSVIH